MKSHRQKQFAIASRVLAGAVGGYVLTSLIVVALFLLLRALGMAKDEALLAPALGSFAIYAGIVMTVFHVRSPTRAWLWLIAAAAPIALFVALLMSGGSGT